LSIGVFDVLYASKLVEFNRQTRLAKAAEDQEELEQRLLEESKEEDAVKSKLNKINSWVKEYASAFEGTTVNSIQEAKKKISTLTKYRKVFYKHKSTHTTVMEEVQALPKTNQAAISDLVEEVPVNIQKLEGYFLFWGPVLDDHLHRELFVKEIMEIVDSHRKAASALEKWSRECQTFVDKAHKGSSKQISKAQKELVSWVQQHVHKSMNLQTIVKLTSSVASAKYATAVTPTNADWVYVDIKTLQAKDQQLAGEMNQLITLMNGAKKNRLQELYTSAANEEALALRQKNETRARKKSNGSAISLVSNQSM